MDTRPLTPVDAVQAGDLVLLPAGKPYYRANGIKPVTARCAAVKVVLDDSPANDLFVIWRGHGGTPCAAIKSDLRLITTVTPAP